jgi:D-amino-acid dehydrogenase
MVSRTDEGVRASVAEKELVERFGVPGRQVNEEEARSIEPALLPGLLGGVYFPEEAHAEPLKVVDRLREEAVAAGAAMLPACDVLDFLTSDANSAPGERRRGARIDALVTTRGILRAREFVLAAGTWSNGLSRKLGIRAPILGGKGYSLIIDPIEAQPKVPMMLLEKKIAVTPREGSLRLAGTLELVKFDQSITHRRVEAIVRGSRQFLTVPEKPIVREIWRGLRPCTPDGLPMIGRTKRYTNLVYACGHQMLGLQSGTGTGKWVADIIQGREDSSLDASLVQPDRF